MKHRKGAGGVLAKRVDIDIIPHLQDVKVILDLFNDTRNNVIYFTFLLVRLFRNNAAYNLK